jgi:hypothetical protein
MSILVKGDWCKRMVLPLDRDDKVDVINDRLLCQIGRHVNIVGRVVNGLPEMAL